MACDKLEDSRDRQTNQSVMQLDKVKKKQFPLLLNWGHSTIRVLILRCSEVCLGVILSHFSVNAQDSQENKIIVPS